MTLTEDRSAPSASAVPAARRAMIVSQLRTCGVNEPWVLEAMAQLAREDFVPAALKEAAYIDRALPLGEGRALASPLTCAKMLAEAAPTGEDTALVVSAGSLYLAELVRPFVGTLSVVDAADVATATGSYSLIVIDGAVEVLPESLVALLADGGRVVSGLALRGVTRLATGRKAAGQVALQPLAELGFAVLPEFAAPKRWSF